jgi:hypothetical protein
MRAKKPERTSSRVCSFHFLSCASALLSLSAAGCDDHLAPPFPAGQGQVKTTLPYPPGPYGVSAGQVITNFEFQGFYAPQANSDAGSVRSIKLSDFYNESGKDVFSDGSPYGAGSPKPKALLIDIGAVWCSPCQFEAKSVLPAEYSKYHEQGAEFLFDLADGPQSGVSATPSELTNWVRKFKTVYPSGIDPQRELGSAFKADAYPVNILIDTRTMKIVNIVAGVPDEDGPFFMALESLLGK